MGMGGISIWQLLIVLAIILLLFGTKRLRNIGTDLGNAIKGFKGAMNTGDEQKDSTQKLEGDDAGHVIEDKVTPHEKDKV